MRFSLLILVACAALAAGVVERGSEAYRAGHYDEALVAFREAVAAAGDAPTAVELYNLALAAMRVGELREARDAIDRLESQDDASFVARVQFLRGNLAWEEARFAEAEARLPDADPSSYPRAIARVDEARRAWMRAAVEHGDWPAAGRNVERALRKREELQLAQAAASGKDVRKAPDEPRILPVGSQPEERAPEETPAEEKGEEISAEDRALSSEPLQLSPVELDQMIAWLARVDREKRKTRREERARRSDTVEKDW